MTEKKKKPYLPEALALAFSLLSACGGWFFFGSGFAFAAVCAGVLFTADVAVLRMIVSAFTKPDGARGISGAKAAVLFVLKVGVLAGIAIFLITVAGLDILGFTTGLTAAVAGIITAGLISQSGTF